MVSQFRASIFSSLLLASALGILWLGYYFQSLVDDTVEVRKIDIAVTPPPPPPPPQQQAESEADIDMQIAGRGAEMVIADLQPQPDISVAPPDVPSVTQQKVDWEAPKVDLDAYALSELDGKPTLLTPVKMRFPRRLKERGIKKVVVKLDVMIDEKGDVTLLNIVDNPYQELIGEIQRFVRASRFSSPFKGSEAVKARFIWPVVIEA